MLACIHVRPVSICLITAKNVPPTVNTQTYKLIFATLTRPDSGKVVNAVFFFDDEALRWPPANGSLPSNASSPPGTEPLAGFGAGGRGGAGARLCCFGGSCGGSEAVRLREGKLSALVPPAGMNSPVPNGSFG